MTFDEIIELKREKQRERQREQNYEKRMYRDLNFCLEQNGVNNIIGSIENLLKTVNSYGYEYSLHDFKRDYL